MVDKIFKDSDNRKQEYYVFTTAGTGLSNGEEGAKLYWSPGEKIKTVSFHYLLAGTTEFSVYFRYWNGLSWLGWNLLKLNDTNITYQFSDTDAAGVELQFNMLLQSDVLDGMQGGQIMIVRNSGSGNITLRRGYAVIE